MVLTFLAMPGEVDLGALREDPGLDAGRHPDSQDRPLDRPRPRGTARASSLRLSAAREDARLVERGDDRVVLVPGLMFARDGGRLGHGKGYYDTLLAFVDPRPYLDRRHG